MSSPVPIAPQLPSFEVKPQEFGLYNPDTRFLDLMWAGKSLRIPGCKDISRDPCKFDDGIPIPGTLVIRDGYMMKPDGTFPMVGSPYNWRADEAIRNLLQLDPDTKLPTGVWSERGITFVPPVIDRRTFEAVLIDANRRFGGHLVKWAEETIRAHEVRVDKAKEHGMNAPAPHPDYARALRIREEHMQSLGVVIEAAAMKQSEGADEAEKVIEDRIAKIAELVISKIGDQANVDKKKMAEMLMEDKEVRSHLSKTHMIRKRGHLPGRDLEDESPPMEE